MLALAWASETVAHLGLVARPLVSTTDVKAFGHEFRFSSAKARARLDWAPSLSPREGLTRAWAWCQAQDPATLLGH
jgi:nucleoside-diphosphate-sugar epimerase